jgi:LAS superfamily LD-carboxypeptidase LdcB
MLPRPRWRRRGTAARTACTLVAVASLAAAAASNHGSGLAVDLCGGIERFGTRQYAWMQANAGRFGFLHPDWAEPGNGREEPWHWEYAGS